MKSTQITPNTLKIKWDKAARLAEILADSAARFAVIVVPMFSPRIIAAADSNPNQPLEHMISVIATVALDDCTIMVRTVPMSRKINVDANPISEKLATNASTSGLF